MKRKYTPCKRAIVNAEAIGNADPLSHSRSLIAGKFLCYLCINAISSVNICTIIVEEGHYMSPTIQLKDVIPTTDGVNVI